MRKIYLTTRLLEQLNEIEWSCVNTVPPILKSSHILQTVNRRKSEIPNSKNEGTRNSNNEEFLLQVWKHPNNRTITAIIFFTLESREENEVEVDDDFVKDSKRNERKGERETEMTLKKKKKKHRTTMFRGDKSDRRKLQPQLTSVIRDDSYRRVRWTDLRETSERHHER